MPSASRTPMMEVDEGDAISQEHHQTLPPASNMTMVEVDKGDAISQEHHQTLPPASNMTVVEVDKEPVSEMVKAKKTGCTITSRKIFKNPMKLKSNQYIKKCVKISVSSQGESNTQRLHNAQKQAEDLTLMANYTKLNKKAKKLLWMQLRLVKSKKMARRFTLQEKLLALALLKQSPKGYKLLQNMFILPNKRTLNRLAEQIQIGTGINEKIFEYIKEIVKSWDVKKKICTIVFDEVALTPHLTFNENKDEINGFVEVAGERRQIFADHALVFMIRGLCASWRQPIAYYFCGGTISAPELIKILKDIIPRIVCTGLKPLALVCDQGSTFRSSFRMLKEDSIRLSSMQGQTNHDGTVNVAGHDLLLFYDPPHLLKSIRNNFLDKDLLFNGKRASWKDILYIFDLDSSSGHTRALPKLTAQHVDPKQIKKMKVKAAAQVLSARTAAMLNYTYTVHKRVGNPLDTMKNTAEVVSFFDDLFDSVNGSLGGTKGKLRRAVKPNSPHQEFWQQSIGKLKNIKFIDINSKLAKQTGKPRHVRPPCLEGWILTLNSFITLSKLLFSKFGIEYFYTRNVNQDPLENFFGRIRAINYRNVNPDANAFIYSFKSLVLSNILSPHSKMANCEEDDGDTLVDMNYLFTQNISNKENVSLNTNINVPSSSRTTGTVTFEKEVIDEKVRVQTSAYTAGYICRKITKRINCNLCADTYTTKDIQGIHLYIQFREYRRLKNSNLAYPNETFLRNYRQISEIIHNYLNLNCHEKNIKKTLQSVINNRYDMSWLGCKVHNKSIKIFYINLMIRLHCHNWCNIINKILNGKIEERYVLKDIVIQKKAFEKFRSHRLRKMKLNK